MTSLLQPDLRASAWSEFGVFDVTQERARARAVLLASTVQAESVKACPFRPNANDEMQRIEDLLAQDDSWLSD